MRRPLVGPHRDDLEIRWSEHRIRRVASAGERKALGLALIAAQGRILAEKGRSPIYLLDDADTELDQERLAAIWQAFAPAKQLIATSNRPQIWSHLGIDRHWHCQAGELRVASSR
jgi:DNA replication and repair protein RecF